MDELDDPGDKSAGEDDGNEENEYLKFSGPVLIGSRVDEDVEDADDPSSCSSFIF